MAKNEEKKVVPETFTAEQVEAMVQAAVLKAMEGVNKKVEEKVEALSKGSNEHTEIIKSASQIAQEMTDSQLDRMSKEMKAALDAQPKHKIKLSVDRSNKELNMVELCVNGYNYFIQRGVEVTVPETIKTLLEEGGYY